MTDTSIAVNGVVCQQVSQAALDFLLAEIVNWVQSTAPNTIPTGSTSNSQDLPLLRSDQNAAKMERMGYDVGYRFTERLASTKAPFFPLPSGETTSNSNIYQIQLETVKFICKDFWIAIFHKQMDRLQTNHRGTFVLKDLDFAWLKRLKSTNPTTGSTDGASRNLDQLLDETNRRTTMLLLALICGMIRGALASFGIGGDYEGTIVDENQDPLQQTHSTVVVTCDFFADGKNLECCSFQVKVLPKE
jgi:hypothetical protein